MGNRWSMLSLGGLVLAAPINAAAQAPASQPSSTESSPSDATPPLASPPSSDASTGAGESAPPTGSPQADTTPLATPASTSTGAPNAATSSGASGASPSSAPLTASSDGAQPRDPWGERTTYELGAGTTMGVPGNLIHGHAAGEVLTDSLVGRLWLRLGNGGSEDFDIGLRAGGGLSYDAGPVKVMGQVGFNLAYQLIGWYVGGRFWLRVGDRTGIRGEAVHVRKLGDSMHQVRENEFALYFQHGAIFGGARLSYVSENADDQGNRRGWYPLTLVVGSGI